LSTQRALRYLGHSNLLMTELPRSLWHRHACGTLLVSPRLIKYSLKKSPRSAPRE